MIRLQKIQRNDRTISCEAFVEDSVTPIPLCYDFETQNLDNYVLPDNYEYCKEHISFAKDYLKNCRNIANIPEKKTIMWY